jgi:hypothetical protein
MAIARRKFGNWDVEVEYESVADLFEKSAVFEELGRFLRCPLTDDGKGTTDVRFVVREYDGNKFYELRSNVKPYAQMQLGLKKDGKTLFPKKQEDGAYWFVYNKDK